MKRYVMITSLLLLCHTAAAQKYTVALLAKLGGAKSNASVNSNISNGGSPSSYKFHLNSEGVTGGAGVDVSMQNGSMLYGFEAGGYMDGFQAKNKDGKIDLNDPSSEPFHDEYRLKRKYTLEFAGKIGWFFNETANLYGKAGVVYSKFMEGYSHAGLVDTKKNFSAWGGVIGLGLQKKYQTFALGFEYDLHAYTRKTVGFSYGTYMNKVKTRPLYHNLFVTLSKPL